MALTVLKTAQQPDASLDVEGHSLERIRWKPQLLASMHAKAGVGDA